MLDELNDHIRRTYLSGFPTVEINKLIISGDRIVGYTAWIWYVSNGQPNRNIEQWLGRGIL